MVGLGANTSHRESRHPILRRYGLLASADRTRQAFKTALTTSYPEQRQFGSDSEVTAVPVLMGNV